MNRRSIMATAMAAAAVFSAGGITHSHSYQRRRDLQSDEEREDKLRKARDKRERKAKKKVTK